MDYTPKLTDEGVMAEACNVLIERMPLEAEGRVCSGADLWRILLGASAKKTTIHGL